MKRLHLLLVAGALLTVHCASSGPAPKAVGREQAVAGGPALTAIRAESTPAPRIVLETSGSPSYTSYAPGDLTFVVDLPRTSRSAGVTIPESLPEGIASITADRVAELGSESTRVTVRLNRPMTGTTIPGDGNLVISFEGAASMASVDPVPSIEPILSEEPEQQAEVRTETIAELPAEAPAQPAIAESPAPAAPAVILPANPATALTSIRTTGSGRSLRIELVGDGRFEHESFRLKNPQRIVIDLAGVRNRTRGIVNLGDPFVKSVRVAQFKGDPSPVTRVVLDLDEAVDYEVAHSSGGLEIAFDGGAAPARFAAAPARVVEQPTATVTTTGIRDEPAPVVASVTPAPEPVREPARVVEAPAPVVTEQRSAPSSLLANADTEPPAIDPVAPAQVRTEPVAPVARQVVNSGGEPQVPPRTTTLSTSQSEDVFIEPNDQRPNSVAGSLNSGSRTLSPGERLFTGEPIDLQVKDADLKDVLRLFAQLTGLNIAIDPQVTGTVTVEFTGVPWDQALELILKQNSLAFELTGNVMRIGTLARLSAEEAQARQLDEQKRLNVPTTTVSHKLSYAKAADVLSLLTGMASPRGKVVTDERTNQLIITEIPQNLQTMLNMIETIDIPTPQVVIEARIVETTKNFLQQFGVEWGFDAILDPALGTGTGLQFPNVVTATGGPFNFASGNPILGFTFANVLGTFDLDMTLTAAETEGYVRVVSAPKVTAQDNESATIESGLQIPIQTRVNFTTTVQYINATLKLTVTPQITVADTVILEIDVQKIEPAIGLQVVGTTNAPLTTRKATTKLMVRDGGTTVIAGIYQATENRAQSRVPFVHSIPVIGNLFKNRSLDSRHDELLIFITPRIVRNVQS